LPLVVTPLPTPSSPYADVFAIAAELGLIPLDQVEQLREECAVAGQTPAQFLAERGLLSAVELDIVETLASRSDVVPGYRILGLIGKGGMGVVYRAEQRTLGRVVALKTILISRMADRSMLDRFELEARTVGQLRHPNIIAAHDFGRHGGRLYLAMELVEGTDLDHQIKTQGPLDEWLVWGLARQAAAGLAHAAQHRIVHRDVKPANLMLVEPPEGYPLPPGLPMVKIADFGLALLQAELGERTRLTATDTTLGSPHYMAPEQLESSDVDFRADMYALGATVFHALAGRPPFADLKLSQLIAAKLGEGPRPISECREHLEPATCTLVSRLMARQPEERPGSYPELLCEIDAVVHSLRTTTLPAPAWTPPPSPGPLPGGSATDQFPGGVTAPQPAGATGEPPRLHPRRWIMAGIAVGGAALLLIAGLAWRPQRQNVPDTVVPQRVAADSTGTVLSLLNGVDTRGWLIGHGNWVYRPEEAALVGTNGLITRPIPPAVAELGGAAAPQPYRWYRLELILLPLVATPAEGARPEDSLDGEGEGRSARHRSQELHFGMESVDGTEDAPRYVLRRSESELSLGTRQAHQAPFVLNAGADPRPADPLQAVAVTLERLPSGWFVDVNGAALAAVPLRPQERPAFSLRAEGEVRFAETALHPLRPREPE
jgi:serine/threonine protein kinase